jgi:hypothetical protein
MPFIHRPYAEECIATWKWGKPGDSHVVVVDNTWKNIGIMAAHNIGRKTMLEQDADWLIVCSAAIRFGEQGGMDFIEELERRSGHDVVEAAGVFGWHLIAFSRDIMERVGEWDENFTPYGFDDIDLSIRIQRVPKRDGRTTQLWEKAVIDITDMGMGHSIHLGGVRADANPQIEYFKRKWGRHPGDSHLAAYDFPFNNSNNPISFCQPLT